MRNGHPVMAIVGYGRAGKDTCAEWLNANTVLRYAGGCSWVARHHMAKTLGLTPEEAFLRRHEDRRFWFEEFNRLREKYTTLLIRLCLEESDLVCGVRSGIELAAGRNEGLIDLVVWIDRDVPVDPTVEFSVADADIVVRNDRTIDDFYLKLKHFAKALNILPTSV